VAIEGKIDALAQMADGAVHVLDYKTGQPRAGAGLGAYEFQIGLYCEAVRRGLGRVPDSATLVYLGPECTCVPLSADDLIDEAVSEAARLLAELSQSG
jgi:RecB family exonuclease